jgi:hypothetical protein
LLAAGKIPGVGWKGILLSREAKHAFESAARSDPALLETQEIRIFKRRGFRMMSVSLTSDNKGQAWVAGGRRLFSLTGDVLEPVKVPLNLGPGEGIGSVLSHSDGSFWIGTWTGQVLRLQYGDRTWDRFTEMDGLKFRGVEGLLEAQDGSIIATSALGGMARFG